MPRKKKDGRKRTPTKWQRARDEMLAAASKTHSDVYRQMIMSGGSLSPASVEHVLAGRFRNALVEAAFCKLTGQYADVAFPIDEPPFGQKKRKRYAGATAAHLSARAEQKTTAASVR